MRPDIARSDGAQADAVRAVPGAHCTERPPGPVAPGDVTAHAVSDGDGVRDDAVRRSRLPYVVVAIVALLPGIVSNIPTPIYRLYVAEWGLTPFTVTIVFGVYVVGVVLALLFLGGISDAIGRRPALVASIPLLLVSLLLFVLADGIALLLVARVLQGTVAGIVAGAAGATLAELHVRRDVAAAARYSALTGPIAMAIAVSGSTILVELAPHPTTVPYLVAVVPLLAMLVLLLSTVPETVAERTGARLRVQRVSVPAEVRPVFATASAGGIATWAVAGLYLSLGPQLTAIVVGEGRPAIGGVAVVTFVVAGLVGERVTRRASTRALTVLGCLGLALGIAVTVLGVRMGSLLAFSLGTILAGLAWLLPFLGGMRRVAAVAPAERRAETMSAFFLLGFVALAVPVVAVGAAVTRWGLVDAHTAFGVAVTALLLGVAVLVARADR